MKSVYFGTPAIGVQALRALAETSELVGVVCQPDRPAGRGMQVVPCPIKQAATELGLEVYQPTRVRDGALQRWLAQKNPDVAVVFAYGRILPVDVLGTPRFGCINLHASLLPHWRGAAPIQWAIAAGDTETGISLMRMDEGLDTGPVFTQRSLTIPEHYTGGDLTRALAELAVTVIREDLPLIVNGAPTPQDHAHATHAPPITKEHLLLDFTAPARALHHRVRAFAPAPGAFCYVGNKRLKLLETRLVDTGQEANAHAAPGTLLAAQGELLWVQTGAGVLAIVQAQLEGKRAMNARDLINGRALTSGAVLSAQPA